MRVSRDTIRCAVISPGGSVYTVTVATPPSPVLPAGNLIPLPPSVSAAVATAIPDAIATPLHVCKTRARVRPGDHVAVIGAGGGVGIHMVEMAALFGAQVAGLEVSESKFDVIRADGRHPRAVPLVRATSSSL